MIRTKRRVGSDTVGFRCYEQVARGTAENHASTPAYAKLSMQQILGAKKTKKLVPGSSGWGDEAPWMTFRHKHNDNFIAVSTTLVPFCWVFS